MVLEDGRTNEFTGVVSHLSCRRPICQGGERAGSLAGSGGVTSLPALLPATRPRLWRSWMRSSDNRSPGDYAGVASAPSSFSWKMQGPVILPTIHNAPYTANAFPKPFPCRSLPWLCGFFFFIVIISVLYILKFAAATRVTCRGS